MPLVVASPAEAEAASLTNATPTASFIPVTYAAYRPADTFRFSWAAGRPTSEAIEAARHVVTESAVRRVQQQLLSTATSNLWGTNMVGTTFAGSNTFTGTGASVTYSYSNTSTTTAPVTMRWAGWAACDDEIPLIGRRYGTVDTTWPTVVTTATCDAGNVATWERLGATYMDVRWESSECYADFQKPRKLSPADHLRVMIRDRMAPNVVGRARDPYENPGRPGLGAAPTDFREVRARETLAAVIGDEKYKRFLRDGFVTVRGKSGRTYQLFPGYQFTRVYNRGVPEPQLCVVLNGKFPPTDSLIVRFLMVLNDEEGFRKLAVPHGAFRPAARDDEVAAESRPLADLYREIRDGKRTPYRRRAATGSPSGVTYTAAVS